jgi:DegV family protein with EDD domain
MVKIVTDSTADIPPDLTADITVVPCFIQFGTTSFLDGMDITREQFYARLATDEGLPKTASPSAGMFEQVYSRIAGAYDEVISLHVASALSGVCTAARVGAQAVDAERITIFDSESATMGLGWLCLAAARCARAGLSRAQIIALLDRMKTRVHVLAAPDTLEFLRRSGRVGWASAMMGQLLHIKPVIGLYRGLVRSIDRVRTRNHSIRRLIELATELGTLESLAVLHTTAREAAAELARQVAHLAPEPIPVVEVTPVIGTHVGPNGLGLAAVAASGE